MRARNREILKQNTMVVAEQQETETGEPEASEPDTGILERKVCALQEENRALKHENEKLKLANNQLLERTKNLQQSSSSQQRASRPIQGCFAFIQASQIMRLSLPYSNHLVMLSTTLYIVVQIQMQKIVEPSYTKHGAKRLLKPEHELFLVLVRLRLGLLEEDLAYRSSVSQTTISRICTTWYDFLHSRFRLFPIWPTKDCVQETMPKCFKEMYPNTRVIIDYTEIYLERPSSIRSQSVTYSLYKSHNTAKGLIGITPAGAVSFLSDLYTGRTSDKQATQDCGIYNLLEIGDSVMTF